MKSSLTNYRQSPRKVRLVADLVRGKSVKNALAELDMLGKRASLPVKKLILSAVANAKENHKVDADKLVIKEMRVDKGVVLKRFMPRARGSAFGIKKRSSHIHVLLAEAEEPKIKGQKKSKVESRKSKVESGKLKVAVKKSPAKK